MNKRSWFKIIRVIKPRQCDECLKDVERGNVCFEVRSGAGVKNYHKECFWSVWGGTLSDDDLVDILDYMYFGKVGLNEREFYLRVASDLGKRKYPIQLVEEVEEEPVQEHSRITGKPQITYPSVSHLLE